MNLYIGHNYYYKFIEFMRNRAELIETLEKSRHSTNTHTNTKQNTKIKSFLISPHNRIRAAQVTFYCQLALISATFNNEEHIARALLDSGSSACLMTENLFNKLQLPYLNTNKSIQESTDESYFEFHQPGDTCSKTLGLTQENHATGDLVKGVIEFNRFSNFSRLHRSVCYVLRFINLCKRCSSINTSYFTAQELQDALNFIIIQSQKESFPEYNLLLNNKQLPYKNRLLNLNVFLDNNKIIRIGGRLHNSEYSYTKKHPILIQSTHHFAKLLFQFEHIRLMHADSIVKLKRIRLRNVMFDGN
ncbi:hypothetical protein SFRURICE_006283 [Spodoptera frugiperda]|nr:hypothetical protein SFRURICE_006283 [Spodoptera frugiperda]